MRSTSSKANSIQALPRPPSILSKVAAPFTSRKRNPSEFYVESNEPYRQYSPGDTAKGSVTIKVDKAINLTHLVICLHGFAKVFSNTRTPGKNVSRDGALLSSGSGKRGAEYFGNGFASLFEDEVTLCGEGRLNPGKYKFEFQLELPSGSLPTSLDFERGTISYMLTSTMTRPATISPTSQCHCKIKVVESVDIAQCLAPKPRTVSLEAISRKSKTRRPPERPFDEKSTGSQREQNAPGPPIPCLTDNPPQSPAPSEISSTSATSGSSRSWQLRSTSSTGRHAHSNTRRNSISAAHGISTSIELLRGGCLPGDNLPLHVLVNHTKAVKSLQGVIITLYRLARVDTHPLIPVGPPQDGKKPEYEDYYPKSRTGLGGLSLSSAGSSQTFRQDLNQVMVPLIVDPRTLTAIVKTSIQVPENLFPTINTVPGQMISFRYYVEVVVDLRGKLASQERVRSQLGIVNGATGYGKGDPKINGINGSSGLAFPLASGYGCLDTSQIRRERSVVSWPFEIIVGTRDSERRRGRRAEESQNTTDSALRRPVDLSRSSTSSLNATSTGASSVVQGPGRQDTGQYGEDSGASYDSPPYASAAQPMLIPPPEPEQALDEKARLRQAEERLLPSAPPVECSSSRDTQPSAPEAVDQEDFIYRYRLHRPVMDGSPSSYAETIVPGSSIQRQLPIKNVPNSPNVSGGTGEDKAELEMRRLQVAASSPDDDGCGQEQPSVILSQPTAPVIDDDDEAHDATLHNFNSISEHSENHNHGESLPTYRR